jgi:hypothetical protein
LEPDEQDMENTDMEAISGMSSQAAPSMISIPAFQSGGRVERTGMALVHEGEYIYPAPDSEALITSDSEGMQGNQVINYYFPVEVEIVGTLSNSEMQRVAQYVYDELTSALLSQQITA